MGNLLKTLNMNLFSLFSTTINNPSTLKLYSRQRSDAKRKWWSEHRDINVLKSLYSFLCFMENLWLFCFNVKIEKLPIVFLHLPSDSRLLSAFASDIFNYSERGVLYQNKTVCKQGTRQKTAKLIIIGMGSISFKIYFLQIQNNTMQNKIITEQWTEVFSCRPQNLWDIQIVWESL